MNNRRRVKNLAGQTYRLLIAVVNSVIFETVALLVGHHNPYPTDEVNFTFVLTKTE
jgi:hypothetical protein